jgi:hypothetical protein
MINSIGKIGSACIGACLAQRKKLEYVALDEDVPQAPLRRLSFSYGKPPTTGVPTCNDMLIYKYKGFEQGFI